MKRRTKIASAVGVISTTAVVLIGYLLFHGYFDRGLFETKQLAWYSPNQVAIVAERSDNAALGGLEYYVLVADHAYSPVELSHAFYGDAPVFSAAAACLSVYWETGNRLVIECRGAVVDSNHINHQVWHSGRFEISYKNIAPKQAR